VPDYRKISPATHAELATTLYGFLMREGTIPTDWFARQVEQADRHDGDIDTLSNRIAHIRTWTFAANRPDWLVDPEHWQGVTRAVEDKLSDALHERLTERFVDRRTSVLMRRLRENATLETDISKSGEVVVEGHVIGRLDGFMFTPAASSAGSEAKALASAAQKALAGEIDARATRLAHAADGQFVLASDGAIRWVGQPAGKLVAAEETLKPRVRIIADERLTGAPRDAVQARLDLWLKSHIERLLEPLFRLTAAEDITGIARGVAFQLTEALGVLERQKVADEIKGLEQPARATLRKHGVRFGAYHIYLPALLKPAPRVLATQLWALKHGGIERKQLEAIEQLAASGRTSIAADQEISKAFYRIAGYRVCGARAVRVDILERLADLIRPALAWRSGATSVKPPGAIEGFGFTVTGGMTSLTGCSGENFASVLRSLGYRMDRRPKPAAPPDASVEVMAPSPASVEAIPAEASLTGEEGAPLGAVGGETPADASVNRVEAASADMSAATQATVEAVATLPDEMVAAGPTLPDAAEALIGFGEGSVSPVQADAPASGTVQDSPSADTAPKSEPAAEEFIEIWRPIRRDEQARSARHERRPRQRRSQREPAPAAASPPAAPTSENGAAPTAGSRQDASPDHTRTPERRLAADRAERSAPRAKRAARLRGHGDRPLRGDRGGKAPDRPDRDPALRAKYIKGRGERGDRREPDPDSPFAKLAALKEQLEAGTKEPR
jgi:ATP-dependent RNA helicase SUPV3L1/SUV3